VIFELFALFLFTPTLPGSLLSLAKRSTSPIVGIVELSEPPAAIINLVVMNYFSE